MSRSEQKLETMKEADGTGLDEPKRSPESMSEPAPAPTLTDAELEQYTSLYDFDGATNFDADWSQEQQDDFLNTLNETNPDEINFWYANTVATQANPDRLSEHNVEGLVPDVTQEDQAVLDTFGSAIDDEISAEYPAQDASNVAGSQSSQAPPAQDAVAQGSEQLGIASNTDSLEDPTSSLVQSKDNATTQNQLDTLIPTTEKETPTKILNSAQYDASFPSAQTIPSSPMNRDERTASNHQGPISQLPTIFQEPAPVMTVEQPVFRQNEAGAAQNRFEHNLLGGREEYDNLTYAPPPHLYLDPSDGDLDAAHVLQPHPCLQASGNSILGAGIELQRAGNGPAGIENIVNNTKDVVSQRNVNDQRGKASQGSKKRAGWETRPDAVRPRVRMTEEEFQWLRPNGGPRDVFETRRKKAAEERLREEAEADALEKAGMPRPQPKQQKPFKGGIHIEVWEKERLNDRRRAQGKTGRDLFLEKPKLRGKRKGCEMSEAEPQAESKKQRIEESDRFTAQLGTGEMSGEMMNGGYGSSMAAVDKFYYGISERPCYVPNPITGQLSQGMTNSGYINNSSTNHNCGNNYGHFGNNNYISNHFTDTSFGNGVTGSGMTQNGALGSMPPPGAAYPFMGQGSRPVFDGAHQARAVFSHNQHLTPSHSQFEPNARASYDRYGVPPPPYEESIQQFTSSQHQPSQRSTASMYGSRTSGPQAVMNPANESLATSGNGMPSYIAGQHTQMLRSIDRVYHPIPLGGIRSIPNSLIDPMLLSQAQFPVANIMGAQTGGYALDDYDYDEESEDSSTRDRREH
ncbi:hypothetical protein EAE96_005179 [Botrytis aclada]|nr:hypothetical protein EAE96_005179 [Botrytis aclada]